MLAMSFSAYSLAMSSFTEFGVSLETRKPQLFHCLSLHIMLVSQVCNYTWPLMWVSGYLESSCLCSKHIYPLTYLIILYKIDIGRNIMLGLNYEIVSLKHLEAGDISHCNMFAQNTQLKIMILIPHQLKIELTLSD